MNQTYLGPVVVDIAGLTLTPEDETLLANPWVGGVILFSRNFSDKVQLAALVEEIRKVNKHLILAVDHEGGRVQRFREGFSRIPPMQKLGELYTADNAKGLATAKEIGWLLAVEVLAAGLDISFAPVVDVDDCVSDIIGDRSFSANAEVVTKLAGAFIAGMHEAGMATTGKHFPGHGGTKADSHLELPVDNRSLGELEEKDIRPFSRLALALDALMPAHILFPKIDSLPVGFSPWWLKTYLRETLNYQGIIFSDDLTMEGAVVAGSYGERAIKALKAGCDSVLVCNNRAGALEVIEALDQAFDRVVESNLEKMQAASLYTWGELESSERWQKAQQLLALLK